MPTLTATAAKKDFLKLIREANQKHEVYRIHHHDGDIVLLSEEEYDSLVETLQLLSIPGFRESIRTSFKQMQSGETVSFEDAFGEPQ